MKSLERTSLALRRNLLLGTIFDRLARVHADGRLVEEAGGGCLTYNEAADRVARLAAGIAGRIERGDRVVVAVSNTYDLLLLVVAAARAGAIAVPVNPKMRDDEIEYVVADSGASLVIHDATEVLADEPQSAPAVAEPSDVAAIFYTSGTTGNPKGARLTHQALLAQAAPGAMWPSGLRRDEAVVGLPVAHIMGFVVLLAFATAGIPVYFLPKFRADVALDAIEQRRSTMFVGVPAMYRMMLDAGAEQRDLHSIRMWASGADKLPPELARKFKSFGASMTIPFTNINIGEAAFAEGYGMVELAGGVAAKVSPPYLPLAIGDFLGLPLPPYRLRVVDDEGNDVRPGTVGELWVKGPGVLQGYHGRPEATAEVLTEDGWLRTGDMARKGPFGLVFFVGRSKDVIKHGGYSVFAAEVEGALEQHPEVTEAAVIGLPDERKGEVPVAAVILRPGASVTGPELAAWARERMSDYKAPRRVVIVDELPRTGTDKVQKSELLGLFEVPSS
ncbi:MAG: long-chain acyl-CoA synthetase [Actinomycetota bacterium]|jgi:acyl-CoA synthetase (AMP-forming)/AMP-acid ligase II|nr:long-chain acyl-CoA synthetase [Actinomycetota bacterium]